MDHKIDRATMPCVFNLGDIFELIDDGFDPGSLEQQAFVGHRQELIFHVGSELGNQLEVEECFQLFAPLVGNMPSVSHQLAKQVSH